LDVIETQAKKLHNRVNDFKNACSFFKIDKFLGIRVVSIPAIIEGVIPFMNDPEINKILLPFGIVLGGLWGLFSIHRELDAIKKTNPYSYLVSLEKMENKRRNNYIIRIKERKK